MIADNKYSETGSNPYYLNLNNTVKDFSVHDSTNPPFGLLDALTKGILIENNTQIQQPIIHQELIVEMKQ